MNQKPTRPPTGSSASQIHQDEQTEVSRRRSAILETIAVSAEHLMNSAELGNSIREFLAHVGQAAEVDRAYIFENQTDSTGALLANQRYKWMAPAPPPLDTPEPWDLLVLDVGLERWVEMLGSNRAVHGPVRCLPPNERKLLAAQNIQSILIVPIVVRENWWGFFGLDNCHVEREWSPSEIDAARAAASIIGASLQNAQLHQEIQSRALQLVTLRDASNTIGGSLDQDAVLHLTLEYVCKLVRAPRAAAFLADLSAGIAVPQAAAGLPETQVVSWTPLPLKTSLTGQVIITGRPVFIEKGPQTTPDRAGKRRVAPLPDNVQAELPVFAPDCTRSDGTPGTSLTARAAAFIPLVVGEHVLGTLNLVFDQPRAFRDEERKLLMAIGRQAGIALANSRLFQETVTAERVARRRADQLTALHEIARIVNASLDLDQTLSLLLEQLVKLVPYDSAAVFLREGQEFRVAAGRGFPDMAAVTQLTIKIADNPLLRQVVKRRQSLVLSDAQQDVRFQGWGGTEYVRGWLAVPLLSGSDLVGILTIDSRQPGAYDVESAELAQALADQTAVAIYKARLLDDLQRANRELRRLDELKGQFIQNVAHELRTPLTLVQGYIELLAQGNLDLTTQQGAIQTALSHSATLVRLVEAITTLQDMSLGELTLEPLDPSELVATALQLANQKAIRAGIILQTDCPAELAAVPGDFIWLSQALYQLLDNSIKFSPDGGSVAMRLRDDPDTNELQICVEDQGIGVPPDQQEQIFELFYQADGTTTRGFGGTGLGLAIVQHVVQAHGGRVSVESPIHQDDDGQGPGSRFVVRLPRNAG